ncbi:Aspartyl/asparaginy/proline hydroxylase [uncultured Caudovirales phage]|uniref:Aspartyl/asparaginy/proline hydroxylase n=1 Tax=uncultured Caudovirales phage TaxID=2100421 RepID=A0A6J7WIP1_9CAUD|nr:Aspartyl/asparaginy/proline hydroxylase [uncultured Caudovirales phage]CAB5208783.1 Aspartyl/asparaginy/proline hydroxylase [uncultured Caudovirales phage]
MLKRTDLHFDIDPIIEQVLSLNLTGKSLLLNETNGNLLNGPYTVKSEFVNTPIGNLLLKLGDIGEARLLKLESSETYTAHTDPDDRLHLSIISNPHCYLINLEDNTLHNLPIDGYIWNMDTSIMHSAINLGGTQRIHLNVRVRLPECVEPKTQLTFEGGDVDWKQSLYMDVMGYINKKIKSGDITGFEKVNDRSVFINYADESIIDYIVSTVSKKGFTVQISRVE